MLSVDEWIKGMWYVYSMEYYSAVKHEIVAFASTWVELENLMSSAVSQMQSQGPNVFSCGGRADGEGGSAE